MLLPWTYDDLHAKSFFFLRLQCNGTGRWNYSYHHPLQVAERVKGDKVEVASTWMLQQNVSRFPVWQFPAKTVRKGIIALCDIIRGFTIVRFSQMTAIASHIF